MIYKCIIIINKLYLIKNLKMNDKNELKDEIIYDFKEMGILMYGEYMLGEDDISEKYYKFLNNKSIISSLKTRINHVVCYLFYKTKTDPDCKAQINNILSKLNNLKINYYNFFLICNLIHYYNKYFDVDKDEILFLIKQLKKFSKFILNNDIKDEEDSKILVLLFYYYYSILLINLFKNKQYLPNIYGGRETFFKYIESKYNDLLNEYIQGDIFIKKYDNDYISLNLSDLNGYAERNNNSKLIHYILFIKFFSSISDNNNDKKIKNYDFFFYEDNSLNKEIKIGILSRKILFHILNYDEDKIKDFEIYLKKIKNNNILKNENANGYNNSITNNITNNNNIIINENINNSIKAINKTPENNIGSNNNNKLDNNNCHTILLDKYNYLEIIINKNKYLLFNELKNTEKFNIKFNINILNSIQKLSLSLQDNYNLYHQYNITILQNILNIQNITNFNNQTIINNCFFNIIYKQNEIISLSNQLINSINKEEIKETIIDLCSKFYDYLKNENDENKNFIKNYEYLKALITRVFYNYMELLFINRKLNKNTNDKCEVKFKEFLDIIKEFDIDNYLIYKIKADYYFVTNDLENALDNYRIYNSATNYSSPSGLFGDATSTYIKDSKNPNQDKDKKKKRKNEAINKMDICICVINKKYMKIRNYIGFIKNLEKLKGLFKE